MHSVPGPLGQLANPHTRSPVTEEITRWLRAQLLDGVAVYLPEIADYELRRELLRFPGRKVQCLAQSCPH